MQKYLLILLLTTFTFSACNQEDDYTTREWAVASQLGIAHGTSTLQPVLLIKASDDTIWHPVYEGIEGFDYEPGYEYKLRLKATRLPEQTQDHSALHYSLLELISKTPTQSIIPDSYYPTFTMEVAPQLANFMGQQLLGVRFPESGLMNWQPWPFAIEGLEYEPGYAYYLKVGTSVIQEPNSNYYRVQYSVLDVQDKRPIGNQE